MSSTRKHKQQALASLNASRSVHPVGLSDCQGPFSLRSEPSRPRVRRRHGAELSKACDSHEAKGLGGVLPKDKKDRPAFCVAIGMCATTTRPDVRTCHARPAIDG